MTCGGEEALPSTTIFNRCVKTSSRLQECHMLKASLELPYHIHAIVSFKLSCFADIVCGLIYMTCSVSCIKIVIGESIFM